MKGKFLALAIVGAFAASLFAADAQAGNGILSKGKHYNVNFIGHPNLEEDVQDGVLGGNGSGSGGSAIFVPLVTSSNNKSKKNAFDGFCTLDDGTQTEFSDNPTAPNNIEEVEPEGKTRIYFEANTDGKFEIIDRVADKDGALISVPVTDDANRWITLDLWIRVVGKPDTCAEIDGYAYEEDGNPKGGDLWWYSGSILFDREARKSQFIEATDIFTTSYCTVVDDGFGNLVCSDAAQDVSVFNLTFDNYFWQFFNDGTRIIQARFYERD